MLHTLLHAVYTATCCIHCYSPGNHAYSSQHIKCPKPEEHLPGPCYLHCHKLLPHLILKVNLTLQLKHKPLRLQVAILISLYKTNINGLITIFFFIISKQYVASPLRKIHMTESPTLSKSFFIIVIIIK